MKHYCEQCWRYNIVTKEDFCPVCKGREFFFEQDRRFNPHVWCGGEGVDWTDELRGVMDLQDDEPCEARGQGLFF